MQVALRKQGPKTQEHSPHSVGFTDAQQGAPVPVPRIPVMAGQTSTARACNAWHAGPSSRGTSLWLHSPKRPRAPRGAARSWPVSSGAAAGTGGLQLEDGWCCPQGMPVHHDTECRTTNRDWESSQDHSRGAYKQVSETRTLLDSANLIPEAKPSSARGRVCLLFREGPAFLPAGLRSGWENCRGTLLWSDLPLPGGLGHSRGHSCSGKPEPWGAHSGHPAHLLQTLLQEAEEGTDRVHARPQGLHGALVRLRTQEHVQTLEGQVPQEVHCVAGDR